MSTRKYLNNSNGNLNIIGKNLTKIRSQQKLSIEDLSKKLMNLGINISSQSILDIETGSRSVKDYELIALAKVFNIKPDLLLKNSNNF